MADSLPAMASRSPMRNLAGVAALVLAGTSLTACADGFEPNRDGLVQALVDVTELTEEQAECVADTVSYEDADGNDVTSEVLKDLADGTKDDDESSVTVQQFEEDLARAIADC